MKRFTQQSERICYEMRADEVRAAVTEALMARGAYPNDHATWDFASDGRLCVSSVYAKELVETPMPDVKWEQECKHECNPEGKNPMKCLKCGHDFSAA